MSKVKQLRKQKNLTQAQLAKRSGTSLMTVGRLERGEYFPRLENASKIANALGVSIEDIVEAPEQEEKKEG